MDPEDLDLLIEEGAAKVSAVVHLSTRDLEEGIRKKFPVEINEKALANVKIPPAIPCEPGALSTLKVPPRASARSRRPRSPR